MELFYITALLVLILSLAGGILLTALVSQLVNSNCRSCNCVRQLDQNYDKCDQLPVLDPYPRAPQR
jgi:hypothetical protein